MRSGVAGFTLIEVLVALAIVTIGMSAVLEALTSSARTAMYLQRKTFAEWVALDQLESTRLSGTQPADGTTTGKLDMAERSWEWRQKVVESQVPGVLRITVEVRPSTRSTHKGWYASVVGVIGNSVQPPSPLDPTEPNWFTGSINGGPVSAAPP